MKKEYKSPSMEVVKLEMQQYLLEGSKIGGGDAPGGSQLAPSTDDDIFDDEIFGGLLGL